MGIGRSRVRSGVVAFLAALLCARAATAAPPRLAVLPIAGKGQVLAYDLGRIEAALRAEVQKVPGFRVLDGEFTLAQLEAAREMGLRCAGYDVECLVKLGIISEVDLLAVPNAEVLPDGFRVEVTLIDVRRGVEVRRAARKVATREPLASAMRLVAGALLVPERFTGKLVVSVEPPGAEVFVDGERVGASPLPSPLEGVGPGARVVSASLAGHTSVERTVEVQPGKTAHLSLRLERARAEAPAPVVEEAAPVAPVTTSEGKATAAATAGPSPFVLGGGAALAVGTLAAAAATTGALYFESVFWDPQRAVDERAGAKPLGQARWVVALVGAGVTAGGGAALALGLGEAP